MAIKEVIQTINQMQADGVMDRYAIGGAVGATFYLEAVSCALLPPPPALHQR
jgi:tetrahydromethanopterin S-methyltransferase subunit A